MKLDLSPRGLATPVAAGLKAAWAGTKKVVGTHVPAAAAGTWGLTKRSLTWGWTGVKGVGHPVVFVVVIPIIFAGGFLAGHGIASRGVSLVESSAATKVKAADAKAAVVEKALEAYKAAHPETAAGVQPPASEPVKAPPPKAKKRASKSVFGGLLGK